MHARFLVWILHDVYSEFIERNFAVGFMRAWKNSRQVRRVLNINHQKSKWWWTRWRIDEDANAALDRNTTLVTKRSFFSTAKIQQHSKIYCSLEFRITNQTHRANGLEDLSGNRHWIISSKCPNLSDAKVQMESAVVVSGPISFDSNTMRSSDMQRKTKIRPWFP